MSSALRLSIIAVMLLATSALGLIAYKMTLPNAEPVQVADPAPPTADPAPPPPLRRLPPPFTLSRNIR